MNDTPDVSNRVQDLILLIGHNPMPNYLVTALLRPKRIHCLYTKNGTKEICSHLVSVLEQQMPDIETNEYPLDDAANPLVIKNAMNLMPPGAHLNYTGGTKAMTVNAYDYWLNYLGGDPSRASYLDGHKGILYFNDGKMRKLDGCSITLNEVLKLHGLQTGSESSYHPDANIKPEDAVKIMDAVLKQGLRERMNNAFKSLSDCIKNPTEECRQELNILPPECQPGFMQIPGWPAVSSEAVRNSWVAFLKHGGWFEDFVGYTVRQACPEAQVAIRLKPKSVNTGIHANTEENIDTEIDLLVLLGYRIYLISCTTSKDHQRVKMKYYEAQNRVALVGGDLAKAAVACLLDPDKASKVETNATVLWQPAHSAVKVFNIEHIRAWRKGDYSTLRQWLTSV